LSSRSFTSTPRNYCTPAWHVLRFCFCTFCVMPVERRGRVPKGGKHSCTHPDCGASFHRKGHLLRHGTTHTAERPFACRVGTCHKVFTRADNLVDHIKTHKDTVVYPFACAACHRLFKQTQGAQLNQHAEACGGQGRASQPAAQSTLSHTPTTNASGKRPNATEMTFMYEENGGNQGGTSLASSSSKLCMSLQRSLSRKPSESVYYA
jgi:hypothetical protein